MCQRHAEVAERSDALIGAVRWLKRGLRVLDPLEGADVVALRARMRAYLGGIRNRQGRWDEAISACRQAIAEAESVGELSALARALARSTGRCWSRVTPTEATHSWRALEIYEGLGDLEQRGPGAQQPRDVRLLRRPLGRRDLAVPTGAARAANVSGRPADVAFTDCNIGEILSDQGRLDEAEASLKRARRVWSGTGERQAVAFVDVLWHVWPRVAAIGTRCRSLESAEAELRKLHIDGTPTSRAR